MDEERIDPRHKTTRQALRVAGPLVAGLGLVFIVVGAVDLFGAMGSSEQPTLFWCFFVGMPLLFVGLALSMAGFAGAVARYQAGEIAPVAKDTFNYVAKGVSGGVETVARAVGTGLAAGRAGEAPATVVRCHKCNAENGVAARFCSQCGAALAKTRPCPKCGELNDPDARFCDNCGHRFD